MTLEEAIKVCEDNADKIGGNPQSDYHAACYKQVAEWLTELKQWRRVYGICPSYEMCIPECKEGYNAQIAEYKRLLKMAVSIINNSFPEVGSCWGCANHDEVNDECKGGAFVECADVCKWQYADEALKLIGGSENG